MPATPNITKSTGNSAAITLKKGFSGAVFIQNNSADRIFFNSSTPADDNSAYIRAAAGTGEALSPGGMTLPFPVPISNDIPIYMAVLSSNNDTVVANYSLIPYRLI